MAAASTPRRRPAGLAGTPGGARLQSGAAHLPHPSRQAQDSQDKGQVITRVSRRRGSRAHGSSPLALRDLKFQSSGRLFEVAHCIRMGVVSSTMGLVQRALKPGVMQRDHPCAWYHGPPISSGTPQGSRVICYEKTADGFWRVVGGSARRRRYPSMLPAARGEAWIYINGAQRPLGNWGFACIELAVPSEGGGFGIALAGPSRPHPRAPLCSRRISHLCGSQGRKLIARPRAASPSVRLRGHRAPFPASPAPGDAT